jgi:antitoxin MazE
MKVEFLKWGNSLALRVPKAFAQEIGARVGKAANMEARDGKLVVETAGVRKHMSAAGFIDVKLDSLTANGKLGVKGVKSPPPHQFYEFHEPYRQVSHVHRLTYGMESRGAEPDGRWSPKLVKRIRAGPTCCW